MIRVLKMLLLSLGLALLPALPVAAQSLNEAAQRVARQHDARVLSANTIEHDGQRIHVIRILTRDGVVRSVEVPAGPAIDRRGESDRNFDQRQPYRPERGQDHRSDAPRQRGGERSRNDGGTGRSDSDRRRR